jgi:integrase
MTPLALRRRFPYIQKETRRSLRTANLTVAKRLAAKLYMQTTMEYETALESLETLDEALNLIPALLNLETKFPKTDVNILQEYFDDIISENNVLLKERFLADITEQEKKCLEKIGHYLSMIDQTDFTGQSDIDLSPFFIEKITAATDKLLVRISRATGRTYKKTTTSRPAESSKPQSQEITTQPVPARNSFSSVSQEYINERLAGNNWEDKTRRSYEASFELFIGIFGDIPVTDIDSSTCRDFKTKIQQLPKNHSKSSRYRDLTILELLQLKIPASDTLSVESVNKHLGRLSGLFNWCFQQNYMERNYISGMKIRTNKSNIDSRKPFTTEDLNNLFNDPIYTKGKMKNSYYYWLPLIALYSGARIQEICQLALKDVYESDGVLVFDINDESEGKRLKNIKSKRIIPVHESLRSIGIEKHIAHLKKQRQKVLFPELYANADGREGQSQPASKWFARFKTKHGFETDGVKAFHSFRHTFIDELKKLNTPEHITAALAGHSHDPITYGTYGGESPASLLNQHIQKIQYPGFDLSKIGKLYG